MDAEQWRKRLRCRERDNRYWPSGSVKIGVRSWNRPRRRERTQLPCLDCEINRSEQLGRQHVGVEPGIQLALRRTQRFTPFAYVKPILLQISIVRARKRDRFVERQNLSAARLCVCARREAQRCN